jgi:hypothetical protein
MRLLGRTPRFGFSSALTVVITLLVAAAPAVASGADVTALPPNPIVSRGGGVTFEPGFVVITRGSEPLVSCVIVPPSPILPPSPVEPCTTGGR